MSISLNLSSVAHLASAELNPQPLPPAGGASHGGVKAMDDCGSVPRTVHIPHPHPTPWPFAGAALHPDIAGLAGRAAGAIAH